MVLSQGDLPCSGALAEIYFLRLISYPSRALFDAFNSTVSVCSDSVFGQTCGQKALLDQARHPLPPVQKGSFSYSGLGYCNSAGTEKQGVFSSQAYQFLTRLYKEHSLAVYDLSTHQPLRTDCYLLFLGRSVCRASADVISNTPQYCFAVGFIGSI